ncbi:MAG: Gfo/Idh/MocA family oxidoreductase [Rhodospirillaceae bacterium]|jgi:predicted dehydrogenase|nr:Gfo/Idh/MocA family oxidoreductase [Rhodospirillaceae bacterium]MBT3928999.1 Gfo/Idh/MocA family oxidoreductase [Rhodospirillaceae bacterium]MBT4426338.1 Gfo/Idh/MocA family oxidoreductase [Rhodospirillaceae bacterium]MBT5037099.1 Gfo/Idh/MocA family oxidoreductase [Rhodospirillaceae bacterium]MBT5779556.1 Gfo/Idh/MocA family oxidoreductase [Rhodospirillaceae bacterium]
MASDATSARVGVIGLGYWGPNLVRNFAAAEGAQLTALCDLDEAALGRQLERYPEARGTRKLDEIIAAPDVDIVVVSTRPSENFRLCKAALEAGQHVFACKPLSQNPEEARTLAALAEARGLVLHTDLTFLYTAAVRKLRDILDSSVCGELNYIESVRTQAPWRADINVVWDLVPHDIAILGHVLQQMPVEVSAQFAARRLAAVEHAAFVVLNYADGLQARLNLNWLSPEKVRRMVFCGDKAALVYDEMEDEKKLRIYSGGFDIAGENGAVKLTTPYRADGVETPALSGAEALALECQEFLNAVATGGTTLSSGEAGYRNSLVCAAIDRSLKAGGAAIEVA